MNGKVQVVEASRKQGWQIIDRAARQYLNMTGKQFVAAWERGQFKNDERPAVTHVGSLLPFVR